MADILYVRRGRILLRPHMKIRDTGYSRNQWLHAMPAKGGGVTFGGSEPVFRTTVAAQVKDYFGFLERAGFKPEWVPRG